ncbi:MAG TPA: carboxypeptidase-like regulatory domain-containing protein, partial [Roseimicrobium sp.]|nr:carboxypeptidase-like regulatory domain-containing protein [Roseimicrobium sp.]
FTTLLAVLLCSVFSSLAGDINGRVLLVGTPPPETKINLDRHPELAEKYPGGLTTRRYQTGDGGGLQNVMVFLRGDFKGIQFDAPKADATITHQDGLFSPYVMGVRAGHKMALQHPEGSVISADAKVNVGFSKLGMSPHIFQKPEVGIRMKCSCHLWSYAYVSVFDHPFFAVTDKDGKYRITGVPPGRFTVEAYHPKAGSFTNEVTVAEGETMVADISVRPK